MNLLVVVLLAFAAFFFLTEDMVFLAVLCVVGLVLALYYYSQGGAPAEYAAAHGGAAQAAGYGAREAGEGPMVIKVGGKHKKKLEVLARDRAADTYRVRVYPNWENRSMWDEFGKNFLGPVMNVFGSTAYRVASGKHAEKGMDIKPEEMLRGR